jgi:dipicolinate synthase subunit A
MEEMPITLHDSNALILGYGRIGKTLSQKLSGLGANVYVEARKCHDIAKIRSCSYKPVPLQKLAEYLPYMNVIINTIPSIILDEKMLRLIDKECLIIDLASKPGRVDLTMARELGNKAIWALSLPGKVAPVTAAKYLKETVYNIIDELGV